MPARTAWWGQFSFKCLQEHTWSLNDRAISIQRLDKEWFSKNVEAPFEGQSLMHHNETEVDQAESRASSRMYTEKSFEMHRHVLGADTESLTITPRLADRSLVTRPLCDMQVAGGASVKIYVSSPLWFQATAQDKSVVLLDLPLWRPSDSWFGPNTREGELCYAKYTDAVTERGAVQLRDHRAITPIIVVNQHREPLAIERISVPVPLLHLYSDEDFFLWTDTVRLTRAASEEQVEVHMDKQAPPELTKASLVSEPRIATERNLLMRSITSLFA